MSGTRYMVRAASVPVMCGCLYCEAYGCGCRAGEGDVILTSCRGLCPLS